MICHLKPTKLLQLKLAEKEKTIAGIFAGSYKGYIWEMQEETRYLYIILLYKNGRIIDGGSTLVGENTSIKGSAERWIDNKIRIKEFHERRKIDGNRIG